MVTVMIMIFDLSASRPIFIAVFMMTIALSIPAWPLVMMVTVVLGITALAHMNIADGGIDMKSLCRSGHRDRNRRRGKKTNSYETHLDFS